MVKRFESTIRIIVALFLSVFMTNFAPTMVAYATTTPEETVLETPAIIPEVTETVVEQPVEQPKALIAPAEAPLTTMSFSQPNCIDLTTASNLDWNWNGDNEVKVWSENSSKKPCSDVKLYLTSYTMPDTWDGKGFNPTALPQTKFDSDSVTLSKNFNSPSYFGAKTLKVDLPDPCKNAQIDLYFAPEVTELTTGGHGAQYISHKFQYKARNCVTASAPTAKDVCGIHNDKYTIPAQTGVYYKVNGEYKPAHTYSANSSSVTVKAYALPGYKLSGTTQWQLAFTNTPCVDVTVTPKQECVEKDQSNGKIKVEVTNHNDFGTYYKVVLDGSDVETHYISAGDSRTFYFWGYSAGIYSVEVKQLTHHYYKTVFDDSITLKECPCEEPEQPVDECPDQGGETPTTPEVPPTTGNVLGASTAKTPASLPNTGSDSTLTLFIALLAGMITSLVIVRKTTRE